MTVPDRSERDPTGGVVQDNLAPQVILASFKGALRGAEPPADVLRRIGGWNALRTIAPGLIDDPLLLPAVALVARDAGVAAETGEDIAAVRPTVTAIASAMLDTTDPGTFQSAIDIFCTNATLAEIAGDLIYVRCLTLALPPTGDEGKLNDASVVRSAVALEAAARLAICGKGSKNKLLGLLEDVREPQPRRYAQAVVRTVAMASDHWEPDDNVIGVVDILTGVTAPRYDCVPGADALARSEKFRKDVEPDAAWAMASIALSKSLRLTLVADVVDSLDVVLEHLSTVLALDDRDDASLMQAATRLLRKLLASMSTTGRGPQDAAEWDVELADAQEILDGADKFSFDRYGLNHWSGDRKAVVIEGWARLAKDLAFLGDQLGRDSLYAAAVVLDDVCAIYSASRSYELTSRGDGGQNVVALIRPGIAKGFAARAGLLRNLVDYTEDLRMRLVGGRDLEDADDLKARLATAEQVLESARASLVQVPEPPGKSRRQAVDLPRLLREFLGPTPMAAEALSMVPHEELQRLAADLADREAAVNFDPDIMVTATRKRIIAALSGAEDFRDDVVPAVTIVVDQLIRFVRQRVNSQESWKNYQFDPEANEHDLHVDLYEWLRQGQFGSSTDVEVQEVGAGRVDIQIQFAGFHLYLELKVDSTAVPIDGKAAYIKQTVSYQSSDVRIGFLVVLRMARPDDKSPSAHLTEYVSHTTVPIGNSTVERHVVMLEIPGNQTKPSRVR